MKYRNSKGRKKKIDFMKSYCEKDRKLSLCKIFSNQDEKQICDSDIK